MGNACFKPADADAASAASTSTSKPHPELTSSSPDSKRVSAASHFDSPGRSPKSSKAGLEHGGPPPLDDGLALKHEADANLVQEDSILSCTCSDVITSPHLDGAFVKPASRHSRSASREQSPQAGPSSVAAAARLAAAAPTDAPAGPEAYEAFVMQYAEPPAATDSLLRDNAIFMPHKDDSLCSAAGRSSAALDAETAAVARAYGHADDAGDATSGILGVRDPGMLKGSPFAGESDELRDGAAAVDGLFDGVGSGGGDIDMAPRSTDDAEATTPRFSLQWERQERTVAEVGTRPASTAKAAPAARRGVPPARSGGAPRSGRDAEHEAAVEAAIAAAAAAAELREGRETVRLGDDGGAIGRSASLPVQTKTGRSVHYAASPTMPAGAAALSPEQLQAVVASQAQVIAQQRLALQMGSNSMMGGGSLMGGNSMGGNSMMGGNSLMAGMGGGGSMMGMPGMAGVPMMPGYASPPKLDQIMRLNHKDALNRGASFGLHVSSKASPMVTALLGRDGKSRKHSRSSARGAGMSRTGTRSGSTSRAGSAAPSRVASAAMSRTASGAQQVATPLGRAASGAGRVQVTPPGVGSRTSSASSLSVAPMGGLEGPQLSAGFRSNSASTVASSSARWQDTGGPRSALRSGGAQRRA